MDSKSVRGSSWSSVELGPAAHHKHEMRVLNRVLTWRSAEAGRAEMIE